ncbi:hypothetical protein AOLI_G00148890 [Acnodon oligacanthus]
METSPLGELMKALSLLQQTQHQALLDAQRENQARFEALVQGQEADRRLLWSLLSGPSTLAPTPAAMSISKMTPQDDPEAFVELFERAAGDWGWPKKDWAIRLLPLLTGEAQLAAQQLPAQSQLERWLLSKERDPGEILDLVVLEQLITRLPNETAAWVQCHQPGSLDEATRLAEAHMAAYSGAGASTQQPSPSLPMPASRKRVALGPWGPNPLALALPMRQPPPPFCLAVQSRSNSRAPLSLSTAASS